MYGLIVALLVLAAVQDGTDRLHRPRRDSAPRTLVVTYSDGRTSPQLLKPRGGFWTPKFPRHANPPLHDGLPLIVLQVDFEADRDVLVTVSLKYGNPHQKTVPVATVKLGTEVVRVSDLERYGVDPIDLSLDDFSPVPLVQPTVTSASPLLDASVDLTAHDLPIYRVTFRNRAARAVMAVAFDVRGEKEVVSGRRTTNRSTPIVDAASDYTFTLQVGSGETPGFDRFAVIGVLWDNGTVEGDPDLKTREAGAGTRVCTAAPPRARDIAGRGAVERLGRGTEEPGTASCSDRGLADRSRRRLMRRSPLKASRHDSYTTEIGMQQVQEVILQDLDDYVRTHAGGARSHRPRRGPRRPAEILGLAEADRPGSERASNATGVCNRRVKSEVRNCDFTVGTTSLARTGAKPDIAER